MCCGDPHTLWQLIQLRIALAIVSPNFWICSIKFGKLHLGHRLVGQSSFSFFLVSFMLWWWLLGLGRPRLKSIFLGRKHILKVGLLIIKNDRLRSMIPKLVFMIKLPHCELSYSCTISLDLFVLSDVAQRYIHPLLLP